MFTRYSSEQINQVPEGYVQAMGQSPFASFANAALGAYQNFSKMKQEEISNATAATKAGTEATKVGIQEKDAATNRGIQVAKYKTEVANADYERISKLHGEVKSAANTLEKELSDRELEDQSKAPNDPTRLKPEERTAMLGRINKLRGTQNSFLDRMLSHAEGADISRPAAPQNYNIGDGSLLRRPAGFNGASSPQGQGAGGKGEKGLEGEAGPEGSLQYPESSAPEQPNAPAQPAAQGQPVAQGQPTANTAPQVGGNNTPSKGTAPNLKKGDFGYDMIPSNTITALGSSLPITSTIAIDESGTSFVVHNSDTTDPAKNSPEMLQRNVESYRKATLLKYIIDNGLADNVIPTPEESKRALTEVVTKENSKHQYALEKAYALLTRNTDVGFTGFDINADAMTLRFKAEQGVSPSDYLANGTIDFNDVTAQLSGGLAPKSDVASDAVAQLNALGSSLKENVASLAAPDPTAAERFTIQTKLEKIGRDIVRYADDPQMVKTLKTEQDNLSRRALVLESKRQAHVAEQAKQKTILDTRLEVIKMIQKSQEQGSQGLVDTKNKQEIAGKASAAQARYYGANSYEELTAMGGFVSSGLRKIPFMDTDERGRRVPIRYRLLEGKGHAPIVDRMDIPEFVSWAAAFRPDLLARFEGFQPTKENIEKAAEKHKEFSNVVSSIQEITRVYGLKLGVFDKKFGEETATAQVNRAFLVANFRTQLIGPGNPSNFEQDIVRDVIPEASDWFQKDERSVAKLRAISMMAMLGHVSEMRSRGFEPTEETMIQFNKGFKDIVGRELSMQEFLKLENDWTKVKATYVDSSYKPADRSTKGSASSERNNAAFNQFTGLVDSLVSPKVKANK